MSRKRIRTAFIALAAVIVALGAFFLIRSLRPTAISDTTAPLTTVGVLPVTRHDLQKTLTVVAELRPWNVVDVYAKQSGYLKNIYVDYGSRVSAGETLATLDLPEQEAAYQQAQAAYVFAKSDYDRVRTVARAEPGLLAAVDIDKVHAEYNEALDARDQDSVLLAYSNITSPFSGVITKRYADPGALIQAGTSTGTKPIVQVSDLYRLRLVVEVPEQDVQQIHVGTLVDVTLQSTGRKIRGSVSRFSYDVHEDTRTMHTEIDVPNESLALKPGMYASATFVLQRDRDVIAVPPQAVTTMGALSTVWVVNAQDTIEQKTVTTGTQTPEWLEITSGLNVGDRVLFGDRSALAVGERVRPKLAERPPS